MLGWLISVHRVAEDAVRRALSAEPGVKVVLDDNALGDRLAVWQAGLDGRQWIRQVASREGSVLRELESGYPHRYLARAADNRLGFRLDLWVLGEDLSLRWGQ